MEKNFYRERMNYFKMQHEKDRTNLAINLHDYFGTDLSKISVIGTVLSSSQRIPDNIKEKINKIIDISSNLIQNLNEIIWSYHNKHDNAGSFCGKLRNYAMQYLEDFNIKLNFHDANFNRSLPIDNKLRREYFYTYKEILHNVVKHSEATEVNIAVDYKESFNVIISDNGNGFENTGDFVGHGMKGIHERINNLNGTVHVNTSPGKGTQLKINIPYPINC